MNEVDDDNGALRKLVNESSAAATHATDAGTGQETSIVIVDASVVIPVEVVIVSAAHASVSELATRRENPPPIKFVVVVFDDCDISVPLTSVA